MCLYSFFCRKCTQHAEKWNKSLLFVSRYYRTWNKKESTRLAPMTSLLLASCGRDWTVCKQGNCREIEVMSSASPYQLEPGRSRSDLSARRPSVLPEDGGKLSYSPHVIFIDSSTEIMSLALSVWNIKPCRTKRHFKVHFHATLSRNSSILGLQ